MNKPVLNDYLASLQQQVAVSVSKLKDKTVARQMFETYGEEQPYALASGHLSAKAYTLLPGEVSYQLLNYRENVADSSYAAQSYDAAANVNRPSSVLIDFMFVNNREFDFKV